MKKLLGLLLLLLLVGTVFTACNSEPAETASEPTETNGAAQTGFALDEVMVEVEGDDITWGELNYDLNMLRGMVEMMHPLSTWDEAFDQEFYDEELTVNEFMLRYAIDIALERRAVRALFAEMNLSLEEGFQEEVIAELKDSFGLDEAGLAELLAENDLTEELFIYLNEIAFMQEEMRMEVEISEEELPRLAEEAGILRAKHILISDGGVGDETERAQALYEELMGLSGEAQLARFDEMIEEYGGDPGMFVHSEGYTFFSVGVMVEEFSEGTLAIGIGEISEPIRSTFGYHIILRLEVEVDAIVMTAGGGQESLQGALAGEYIRERLDEMRESLNHNVLAIAAGIIPSEVFAAQDAAFLEAMQAEAEDEYEDEDEE